MVRTVAVFTDRGNCVPRRCNVRALQVEGESRAVSRCEIVALGVTSQAVARVTGRQNV